MAKYRKTIENDEEFLRQVSVDVDFIKDDYMDYINQLREYCTSEAVYALAPVQIGIPKRMIYLRNTTADMSKNTDSSYNEDIVLINPVIIRREGHTRFLERCESCLDLAGVVDRPYLVEVSYYDIDGQMKNEVFEGFKATVFSHEYDHLNGILHIDLADELFKFSMDETKNYREHHPYEIISKTGKFDDGDLKKGYML